MVDWSIPQVLAAGLDSDSCDEEDSLIGDFLENAISAKNEKLGAQPFIHIRRHALGIVRACVRVPYTCSLYRAYGGALRQVHCSIF